MSWEMVKLQDLTENGFMVDGDWIESKDQDPSGEIRLLQLADIGDGYFIDKSNRFINQETSKKLKCTFLKKNDILIARMPDPIGRACIFPFEEENMHVTVVDVCIMRIKNGVDPQYVTYAINSPGFRNKLESQITGTTRQRISGKNLKNLEIPLPPLATQKRIAEILDAADALRRKDQELLKKYDELAQAIFIDMFGDPVKNEKGWEVKEISQIVQSEDHLRVPIESSIREGRKGIFPYYGASGIIDYVDDYIFEGKRLLIGEDGANLVARSSPIAFIADGKYWVNNHAHVLGSTNKSLLFYLRFWFNSISLMPYITGSAQPKLNGSKLLRIKVPFPDLNLVENFMGIIQNLETQKKKEFKSNILFNTLIQKAFKGELVA